MTFDAALQRERGPSVYALFEFQVAENVYYRYTDADETVWHLGEEYVPEPITYSDVVSDGTLKQATMTVEARYNLRPAKVFRTGPPSFITTLKIMEANFTDDDREYRQVWSGRVLNCRIEGEKAKFSCEPLSTTLSRPGLRRNYQRSCPHAVYGDLCKATRVEQPVTLVSTESNVWTVSQPASGYIAPETYEGGLLSWEDDDGQVKFQTILTSVESGSNLVLGVNMAISPAISPINVKIVKGCNHTENACTVWHNNIHNYGGCPFIPLDTPVNKFSTFY